MDTEHKPKTYYIIWHDKSNNLVAEVETLDELKELVDDIDANGWLNEITVEVSTVYHGVYIRHIFDDG